MKIVLALPLYEETSRLPQTLESLLAQDLGEFALLILDDSRTDEPEAIVRDVAGADGRVSYRRNPSRLGLLGNWRHAVVLARALHPDHVYFAWVGDHDVYEPSWLRLLARELDAHPEAVLAYPLNDRIDGDGRVVQAPWRFDTSAVRRPARRYGVTLRRMVAGDMVYGLFRASALAGIDPFPPVLMPDRLLLAELSFAGTFRQVPSLLWHRRVTGAGTAVAARQRATLFAGPAPRHSYAPWHVTHAVALTRSLLVHRRPWPVAAGAGLAYPLLASGYQAARAARRIRSLTVRAR